MERKRWKDWPKRHDHIIYREPKRKKKEKVDEISDKEAEKGRKKRVRS